MLGTWYHARSLVGDRKKLPRGRLADSSQEKDEEFWKSVHLGGLRAAKQLQEVLTKEQEEWRSKIVVDDTHFKVRSICVCIRRLNFLYMCMQKF